MSYQDFTRPEDLCSDCNGVTECAPSAILLISLVHALYGFLNPKPDYFKKNPSEDHDEVQLRREGYDFIIVGGGTAGCVLASRLSENPKWKVLLIEAGGEQPRISTIPALARELRGTTLDWQFSAKRDARYCWFKPNHACDIPQGRVMGGTSSINDMLYIRGNAADFDDWAKAGCDGWSYKQVLPYFKYSEGNYDDDILKGRHFHSSQGPLDIGRYPFFDKNSNVLLRALSEMNINITDINGKVQIGAMRAQAMTINGERVSTYAAFIDPVRYLRKNLDILTEALATKITFIDKKKFIRARGVKVLKNGKFYHARAKKEVIISAGAFNTPKLLMLSGIGPKDYLERLGILVKRDLPIGKSLQDHLSVCLPLIKVSKSSTVSHFLDKIDDIITYYNSGSGPMSANYQIISFLETSLIKIQNTPDLIIIFKGINSDMYYDSIEICIGLLTPESEGEVKLNSIDSVFSSPEISLNYFSKQNDIQKIIEGIRMIMLIFETESFLLAGFKKHHDVSGTYCARYEHNSDEYWNCYIRYYTQSLHNYVGTCKMGSPADPMASVDSQLKVYGTSRLRVVDSSIIPKITRGGVASVSIMIAEKASDMIKGSWF